MEPGEDASPFTEFQVYELGMVRALASPSFRGSGPGCGVRNADDQACMRLAGQGFRARAQRIDDRVLGVFSGRNPLKFELIFHRAFPEPEFFNFPWQQKGNDPQPAFRRFDVYGELFDALAQPDDLAELGQGQVPRLDQVQDRRVAC